MASSWNHSPGQIPILGWIGLALMGLAVLVDYRAVRPIEARIEALQDRINARRPTRDGVQRVAIDQTPQGRMRDFYAFFGRDNYDTDQLVKLQGIAEQLRLSFGAADYSFETVPGSPLTRYRISFPLTGSYGQIRAFAEDALLQIPALSLDGIRFRRMAANTGTVQAELRLTLYGVNR
jgi:hypothetical protein